MGSFGCLPGYPFQNPNGFEITFGLRFGRGPAFQHVESEDLKDASGENRPKLSRVRTVTISYISRSGFQVGRRKGT